MALEYGGLRARALALALDWVVVCAWLIVVALTRLWWAAPWPVLAYFTWLEGGARQASWGKQQVGLKVMRADGRRLSFVRAGIRNLLRIAPWAVTPMLPSRWRYEWAGLWLAGAAIPLVFGPKYRAWYDRVAGTAVIRTPPVK